MSDKIGELLDATIDRNASTPEPPPRPNDQPAVWLKVIEDLAARSVGCNAREQPVYDRVLADMHERDAFGREKYGTPLQPFNGRDALVDAYQEALDLCVYLKQSILGKHDGMVWANYRDALERVVGLAEIIHARKPRTP